MHLLRLKTQLLPLSSLGNWGQRFERDIQGAECERLTSGAPVVQRHLVLAHGPAHTLSVG